MDDLENKGVPLEISKTAEATPPSYFKNFLTTNRVALSNALRLKDIDALSCQLKDFAKVLPKDVSFKEIAALIFRRGNGQLYISIVEGNFEEINAPKAGDLIDDLIQRAPIDTEQVLFLHTHPSPQSPIGPIASSVVGFSFEDKRFLDILGSKLRILDTQAVYAGLITSNSNRVLLTSEKIRDELLAGLLIYLSRHNSLDSKKA